LMISFIVASPYIRFEKNIAFSLPYNIIHVHPAFVHSSVSFIVDIFRFHYTRQGGVVMANILEAAVDSLASARAAIAGGADRLEFCSALAVGGLSPYAALLQQIRGESDIPIRCLIRSRAGDFLYTKPEILMMAAQIEYLKKMGADGFVIGCLNAEGDLDASAMEPLLKAAEGDRFDPAPVH